MKITTKWEVNLKTKEVEDMVGKAAKKGLLATTVAIAGDAIKGSPVLTGNNRRSIAYEVGSGGEVAKKDNEAAVFSTSGYGGYLETGTTDPEGAKRMDPRPYFKPALDKNMKDLPKNIKAELT